MGSGNVFVDSPFVQVDFNVVSCFSCLESASLPQQVFMAHLFRLGMRCSHFQDAYEVSMEIFNGQSCNSLMPLLVKPETFENAVAWNSGIFQACAVLGPIVAGAILAMGVPTWGVLLFNARETRAELVRKDEQPFTRWNLTFLPHLFDFDRAGELSTLGLCIFFLFLSMALLDFACFISGCIEGEATTVISSTLGSDRFNCFVEVIHPG
jgi:hypothetical protein